MKINEKEFDKAVEEWIEYCDTPKVQVSSRTDIVKECDAYRKILSMSYEVLPLIRKLYDKNDFNNFALSCIKGWGLVQLVQDIVGKEFQIPERIKGNAISMEVYTKNWLDDNLEYLI